VQNIKFESGVLSLGMCNMHEGRKNSGLKYV
jgi:hypothetical protein